MDWADAGNAFFEIVGAVTVWLNVRALLKSRKVRGVDWRTWVFFTLWGWWNIFYYGPYLGQWLSWWAGLVLVSANTTWVVLAYRARNN